nr:hypothetical protein [Tanacetum cinerariifolium]
MVKKEAAKEKDSSDANSDDGDFGLCYYAHSLVLIFKVEKLWLERSRKCGREDDGLSCRMLLFS